MRFLKTSQHVLIAVLGVPFGAGTAHVMEFWAVAIAGRIDQVMPTSPRRAPAIAKRRRGGEECHQHGQISQCALPSTEAKGIAKISSPKSSLA
jgi:hypothetical protein